MVGPGRPTGYLQGPPIGPTLRLPTTADNRVVSQFDLAARRQLFDMRHEI